MTQGQLEALLRKAPRPKAPPGLRERLQQQITLPPVRLERPHPSAASSFWQRWLPAFAFGLFFLACLVVIALQTTEIIHLRRENASYRASADKLESLRQAHTELQQARLLQEQLQQAQKDNDELHQLEAEVTRLQAQVADLPKVRQEYEQLRNLVNSTGQQKTEQARPNHPRSGVLSCGECHGTHDPSSAQLSKADEQQKMQAHSCAGLLKYISLVARAWAETNANAMPRDFLTISDELKTPRVLICPLDREKMRASGELVPTTWEQWQPNATAYEILSPGIDRSNRTVPYIRCRNHGHVAQVDGTVLRGGNPEPASK